MIDPDDIEQVRTALRQILAWVDRGKRPTYGDLTAIDWYTLALLPRPDVEEMAGGPLSELSRLTTLRPLSELTDEELAKGDGMVLLWWIGPSGPVLARAWDGSASVSRDWYWSPIPKVRKP